MEVQRVVAALAANATDAGPAEGRGEVADQKTVHPDRSGAQRRAESLGARFARGVDDRRKSVGRRVREFRGLGLVGETLQRQHGAEDFALDNLRVIRLGFDQGRFVPEAVTGESFAPEYHGVAVRFRALDETVNPGEVLGMDQW